jgi:hypothetical protein
LHITPLAFSQISSHQQKNKKYVKHYIYSTQLYVKSE